MPSLLVYDKKTCVTCQKAKAFLDKQKIAYEIVDIVNNPPSKALLEKVIDASNVKASLNIRSALYREHQLGVKVPSKQKAIELMLQDGNLIRRPLIVKANGSFYQGFDEKTLSAFLLP